MNNAEESPAQKQARLRRERRDAKIKEGGSARLDRILNSSGREANTANDASPSPSPQPQRTVSQSSQIPTTEPPLLQAADPTQIQAQEEFLRSMMRSNPAGEQDQAQSDDPTMRLLESFLGTPGATDATQPGAPPISPDDLSKMTGLPSFLTSTFTGMFFGRPPPTALARKQESIWKFLHILFAITAGLYMFFAVRDSVARWGKNPPPLATVQNPFLIFITGELVVEGGKMMQMGAGHGRGLLGWIQILRDVWRDACVAVFILGVGQWWYGLELV
ncbi:MAG: hypothetical protein Q9227_002542 [Pyrenula ochraceoflavens]